ncbi:AMP-binding protein [Streptomyces demainii]|uniref:Non-ribosomal peptide synthetase component F n=1 Tax=Streptomyces demainii TaxID=588122 RepID=A0ABT9L050_9ACTN|nr:AMP-binding protein [Streptomyces demainii]MDP9612951.1 non-ribosomal peptide synthetase component F [Streptomyces demainii]
MGRVDRGALPRAGGTAAHAVAVVDGDERLTYAELDERATAVARGLAARGVRPETLVGMAYDRSAEAVVAMLGIVLAHGAYVPVNPALPRRRVERIVLDAGLGLVLCAGAERDRIAALLPPGITVLDTAEAVGTGTPRASASARTPTPRSRSHTAPRSRT